ncbi:uncharacterized protein LOC106663293 [Cimex lectularius]|uniref:Uncharacterized protein n=1 Tax=Cimex lectularius TaxID=79782 RepID=A0A8I6RGK8_CIMLE|nr:uncharacterized protein LOC106663293 [Cimex lectularius]
MRSVTTAVLCLHFIIVFSSIVRSEASYSLHLDKTFDGLASHCLFHSSPCTENYEVICLPRNYIPNVLINVKCKRECIGTPCSFDERYRLEENRAIVNVMTNTTYFEFTRYIVAVGCVCKKVMDSETVLSAKMIPNSFPQLVE